MTPKGHAKDCRTALNWEHIGLQKDMQMPCRRESRHVIERACKRGTDMTLKRHETGFQNGKQTCPQKGMQRAHKMASKRGTDMTSKRHATGLQKGKQT